MREDAREGGGGAGSHDQSELFLNLGNLFLNLDIYSLTSHVGSTLDIPFPVTSQSIETDSKLTVKKSFDVM